MRTAHQRVSSADASSRPLPVCGPAIRARDSDRPRVHSLAGCVVHDAQRRTCIVQFAAKRILSLQIFPYQASAYDSLFDGTPIDIYSFGRRSIASRATTGHTTFHTTEIRHAALRPGFSGCRIDRSCAGFRRNRRSGSRRRQDPVRRLPGSVRRLARCRRLAKELGLARPRLRKSIR